MVYHGETCLGELGIIQVNDNSDFRFPNNEIRISHISPVSERCPPLSVLQTISSYSVRCKLESTLPSDQQPQLLTLHASCFYEYKTAVVALGEEEIHLVAMPSKQKKFPCFWCYSVPCGLYNSCLRMLNLRCLAIVFDLDETLIVANTMKSFEDRIENLKVWISHETDPVRLSGMSAELKRYMDDRALLKQFTEYDCVADNGKVYKVQNETVPPLSDGHEKVIRPVIRLQEKNVVLTRINPEIRDTSVLVRLRPAWEDLRSYLTAKGRKRFEVYVCTMAERDYALEMWRLLDPEAHLINSTQLLGRVVCVKSGSKKSLLNVFQDGLCHPNMAMVIDDRSKVWEDKDQPRVHVVPAFTPYYAPQVETANPVPILCVARNVACNVRGGFFKEFDENLLRRISELFFEDEVLNLPSPPDVSNYLLEDTGSGPNRNSNIPIAEDVYGADIEQRLHQSEVKSSIDYANNPLANGTDMRSEVSQPPMVSASVVTDLACSRTIMSSQKPSLLGVPAKRESFSSEYDLDVKRKVTMVKHGGEIRNPVSGDPPILRLPVQIPAASVQSKGGWLVEEDINRGHVNNRATVVAQESDLLKADKQRTYQGTPVHRMTQSGQSSDLPLGRVEEASSRNEWQKQNLPSSPSPLGGGMTEAAVSHNQASLNGKEFHIDALKPNNLPSGLFISVLQEIGRRCSSKVEFKTVVSTGKDLQFCVEVLFTGEKIGTGIGRTRKDAQQQAAEKALHSLADKYLAYIASHTGGVHRDIDTLSISNENGFLWDDTSPESQEVSIDEKLPKESSSEGVELPLGGASSAVQNQQVQKHANSPR
ncbi:hypothetical protein Nepgr_031892 [Nepenthes gracilis]|uniref:protein-serine/threonine phosphatase n=1 Tax=Nepenthes gracilis TaxID=150966 RepID=A0AAD3TJ54_NEPGR|nr:hypothetical protein Nepgr_031892 [Nepenthes gracilis]